jgi:hypothetical protein
MNIMKNIRILLLSLASLITSVYGQGNSSSVLEEYYRRQNLKPQRKTIKEAKVISNSAINKMISTKKENLKEEFQSSTPTFNDGLNLYISPFELERIGKFLNTSLGIKYVDTTPLQKDRGGEFNIQGQRLKRENPYKENTKVSYTSIEGYGLYYFNNIWKNLDFFSSIYGRHEVEDQLTPIHYRVMAGPIGAKISLIKGENINEFSIGYIPIYESNYFDEVRSGKRTGKVKKSFIRHNIMLRLKMTLFNRIFLDSFASWRPKYDFDDSKFLIEDSDSIISVNLSMNLFKGLGFSYQTKIIYDVYRKKVHQRESTDLIQSAYLNYNF